MGSFGLGETVQKVKWVSRVVVIYDSNFALLVSLSRRKDIVLTPTPVVVPVIVHSRFEAVGTELGPGTFRVGKENKREG